MTIDQLIPQSETSTTIDGTILNIDGEDMFYLGHDPDGTKANPEHQYSFMHIGFEYDRNFTKEELTTFLETI